MKVQVLKKLTSLGVELQVGDIVDASGWKHTKNLISGRYIKPVEDEPKISKKSVAEVTEEKPKAKVSKAKTK